MRACNKTAERQPGVPGDWPAVLAVLGVLGSGFNPPALGRALYFSIAYGLSWGLLTNYMEGGRDRVAIAA